MTGPEVGLDDKMNGRLAEWLGTALQKLLQRFESAIDLIKHEGFIT